MIRHHDWPCRLIAALDAANKKPFAWGVHDCVMFSAGIIKAITGEDVVKTWRGKYRSAAGAARLLGKQSMDDLATGIFGPPIPWGRAQRGDLVLIDLPRSIEDADVTGPAFGICIGSYAAFPTTLGLVHFPMADVKSAWAVARG